MSVVAHLETPSGRTAPAGLTFVHWTLRDDPRQALAVVAPIAAVVALVAVATHSAAVATIAGLAMCAASCSALLPIRYVFDATGIERRVLGRSRRIAWAAISRCEEWPHGVRLFRIAEPRPLEALRAAFIPFAGQRGAVLEQLDCRALRCHRPGTSAE